MRHDHNTHSEMVRYDRVPTRNESEDVEDLQDDNIIKESMFSPAEDRKSTWNRSNLKRRGSHSSGSYTSINSDDDDYLNSSEHFRNANHGDDKQRSPLNTNVNNSRNGNNIHNLKQANDAASDSRSTGMSSQLLYPPTTAMSFDLNDDDDDDELEANLKRYHLDFSSADNGEYFAQNNQSGNGNFTFSGGGNNSNWCSSAANCLWFYFQSVRQRARHRRAQMLLQQSERNWRQSLKICVLTNCDATDSGILLVVVIMVIWIVCLTLTKNPVARRKGLIVGISFFVVRVGIRPLYHLFRKCWEQRRLLRRQQTIGSAPQSFSASHQKAFDESLELRAIRGNGGSKNPGPRTSPTSTGSDPTIAAI
mmetsp:Transcript_19540/g.54527  ORF Transcript_19540/g.54527 Transcript_19540/m.54527 type:complete len:364 (+) Transcript_19540:113-1204(+)